jgi:hypothetical protein
VNPWITSAIDLGILVALILQVADWSLSWPALRLRHLTSTVCLWLLIGAPAAAVTYLSRPAVIRPDARIIVESGSIILEPSEWIGGRFPLNEYLSQHVDVSEGNWLVVLYHHDCPECQEALVRYDEMSRQLAMTTKEAKVLLVEVPPYATEEASSTFAAMHMQLSDQFDWFVQTPTEILIQEGQVKYAGTELLSIGEEADFLRD